MDYGTDWQDTVSTAGNLGDGDKQPQEQQLQQLVAFTKEPAVAVNGVFAYLGQHGEVYLAFHQSFHPQMPSVPRVAVSMNVAEAGKMGQLLVDLAQRAKKAVEVDHPSKAA
jgi:hypothetical protein